MTEKEKKNNEPELRTEELDEQDLDQVSGGVFRPGHGGITPPISEPGTMHTM